MSPSFRAGDSHARKLVVSLRRNHGIARAAVAWLMRPTPRAFSVIAYSVVAGLCVWAVFQATGTGRLAQRVARDEHRQTANRADNVLTWCHAINDLQRALGTYVSRFPHVPPLGLKQLPCGQLAARTKRSTQ